MINIKLPHFFLKLDNDISRPWDSYAVLSILFQRLQGSMVRNWESEAREERKQSRVFMWWVAAVGNSGNCFRIYWNHLERLTSTYTIIIKRQDVWLIYPPPSLTGRGFLLEAIIPGGFPAFLSLSQVSC